MRRAWSSSKASTGQGGSKNCATSSRQPEPGHVAAERANARVQPQPEGPDVRTRVGRPAQLVGTSGARRIGQTRAGLDQGPDHAGPSLQR
jgi:hypothetical protein